MSRRFTRGFTLIELLVVIAIIGILASVVLVSLQSARKKGNDTRVIAGVKQIQTLIESTFANNRYNELTLATTLVPPAAAGTTRKTLEDDIISQQTAGGLTGLLGSNATGIIVANGTYVITKTNDSPGKGYAIYAKLPSGQTFCIDGEGKSKMGATYPAAAPASSAAGNVVASNCQ